MPSVYRPLVNFVAKAMQAVLNLACCAWGYSGGVPGKETLHLAHVLFTPEPVSKYKLVEGLVVYFLYLSLSR
jgi:protein PsiE